MGFFSWLTSDTKESIRNIHTGKCRTVYLYCPNGTVLEEEAYDGYGTFGGKDAYVLLAQWNAPEECAKAKGSASAKRAFIVGIGIRLMFDEPEKIRFPLKFSFKSNMKYSTLAAAEQCPLQGYFEEDSWAKITS